MSARARRQIVHLCRKRVIVGCIFLCQIDVGAAFGSPWYSSIFTLVNECPLPTSMLTFALLCVCVYDSVPTSMDACYADSKCNNANACVGANSALSFIFRTFCKVQHSARRHFYLRLLEQRHAVRHTRSVLHRQACRIRSSAIWLFGCSTRDFVCASCVGKMCMSELAPAGTECDDNNECTRNCDSSSVRCVAMADAIACTVNDACGEDGKCRGVGDVCLDNCNVDHSALLRRCCLF